jgi:polar amino acid transport system substrate-binding protein
MLHARLRPLRAALAGLSVLFVLTACQREAEAPAPPPAAPAPACTLTMGWDPWEPYHFEDVDGKLRGLEIELVEAIANGAGCTMRYERGQWNQLLAKLDRGEIDVLSAATPTEERRAYALFSEPYRSESFRLFVRAGEAERFSGQDLPGLIGAGMRIGTTLGYVYTPEISALRDGDATAGAFVDHPEAELAFLALIENRVDGVLEDPYVAAAILRRRGWQDLVVQHPLDLGENQVSFMFSKASVKPEVVQRFDQSLAALKQSGQLEAIVRRYRL